MMKAIIPAVLVFFLAVGTATAQISVDDGKPSKTASMEITQNTVSTEKVYNGNFSLLRKSGNESYFDVVLDKVPNTTITIITATFNETRLKDENPLSLNSDITYVKDLQLPITINNEPTAAIMATLDKDKKNRDIVYETGDTLYFRYLADSDTDFYILLGESSIEIVQQSVTYGLDYHDGTRAEPNNYTHLEISETDPYDSLVLYYDFNNDVNGSAGYDIGVNRIDYVAESSNVVLNNNGDFGTSLYLPGNANDDIEAEVDPALNFNDTITVCWWFWKVSGSSSEFAFGKHGAIYEWAVYMRNTEIFDWYGSAGDQKSTITFAIGEWEHACIADNDTSVLFVLNGNTYESFATNIMQDTIWNEALAIGSWGSSPNYYFEGWIDEFMVFNKSLSLEQMQAIYNNQSPRFENPGTLTNRQFNYTGQYNRINYSTDFDTQAMDEENSLRLGYWDVSKKYNITDTSLYAYYPFDNNDTNDKSQHYFYNYTRWGPIVSRPGLYNDSINISTANDGLQIGDNDDFYDFCENGCTISAWINAWDNGEVEKDIVKRWNSISDDQFFKLIIDSNDWIDFTVWENGSGSGCNVDTNEALTYHTWTFVAGVFSPNDNIYVYMLNPYKTAIESGFGCNFQPNLTAWQDDENTYISVLSNYYFSGFIDDLMMFNRSLSQDEIYEMYNKGLANWDYTDYQNITAADTNYTYTIDSTTTNILPQHKLQGSSYNFYTPYIGGTSTYSLYSTDEGPDETPPTVTFSALTDNNETVTRNYSYVDLDLDETGDTCLLEWNGTNETMTGSGTDYYVNKTLLVNGNYTFQAYCNDTAGNLGQSETRWVYINWTAPVPGAELFCWSLTSGQLAIPKNCEYSVREEVAI